MWIFIYNLFKYISFITSDGFTKPINPLKMERTQEKVLLFDNLFEYI